ncbi:sigma-54-dependent Fis family transcriptional regulator [Plesiomonas shigelloides]|uniref:sigma-54 interaction domain-containing protein n=1 Tax=Plesiomonas shigelloides TaxID=703 RepID=UPI000D13E53A|nr:sigma-54-dependent Fis family transcriptional regulator [Plesiomonas shigelloides]AVQ86871.1 sigma-54-dependent Fis family transcriptional regulator [Plesiomonas shigelloides]
MMYTTEETAGHFMLIDNDETRRNTFSIILNFIGIDITAVTTEYIFTVNNTKEKYTGIIIGLINDTTKLKKILTYLESSDSPPVIFISSEINRMTTIENCAGILSEPFNYLSVIDAIKHCHIMPNKKINDNQSKHRNRRELLRSLTGNSFAIKKLRQLIIKVAPTDSNVMIFGESGTGKEIVARNIHQYSDRHEKPFIAINCGAIPSELLESELFGYEKGAFTGAISSRKGKFELAEGGTIFLDEIGDMPTSMQVKLLRILQEKAFERVGGNKTISLNVRVIAATHQKLENMVLTGRFRQDLYYRINVFPIEIPSLKERIDDIPLLVNYFIEKLSPVGVKIDFTPDALSSLCKYEWPGNIRELSNLIERLTITHPNQLIDSFDLPDKYKDKENIPCKGGCSINEVEDTNKRYCFYGTSKYDKKYFKQIALLPEEGVVLKSKIDDVERNFIKKSLEIESGVIARAANLLGMKRTTLVEKMRKHGIKYDGQ